MAAVAICFRLLWHVLLRAFSRALAKTGKRIAARMAIIAITTSSSINVNPFEPDGFLMVIPPLLQGIDTPATHNTS
jgi:hypothetical protein